MKALKIIGWTLLGIVLTVVAAVCIVCYVIVTPARLTPIARQAADQFITCPYEIGEVDLTFFSTFPRFGLRADGLLLINPKEGAQNDTVVYAKRLTATVDVMEFIHNKNLHVHEAILDDADVHFYIAPDGTTNLTDVFVSSPDTTAQEDTTAFSLPFQALRVDGLRLQARQITFVDEKDTVNASLGLTELSAKADSWDDMLIALDAQDVCASLKGEPYADSLHIELIAPMAMHLDSMYFAFDGARLAINEFQVTIEGTVALNEDIDLDVALSTGQWQIKELLALVPASFTSSLKDIDIDGKLQLDATVKGTYNDTLMPLVTAKLNLKDGKGSYKPLPYILRDLTLQADADLNLNKGQLSNVRLQKLSAKTKDSQVSVTGNVNDLLGNMLLDLHLNLDANIPDFDYFLPDSMRIEGRAKGKVNARIRLNDLTNMRLEKGKISADLDLTSLRYEQDSMVAMLPRSKAKILIPNAQPAKPSINWARVDIETEKVDFIMGKNTNAFIDAPVIHAEVANILNNKQDYFASIRLDALDAKYDDIFADLKESELEVFISGGQKVNAKLKTNALNGKMGEELQAKTGSLALEAGARYNKDGENALLKWNPRLKVNLKNGVLNLPEKLPETVYIPSIEFSYSNRAMHIDNSRIELGNSDLNLKGDVRNIGKWFRHQDILTGELDIVSDHCDANQLLAWFSADEGSEEEATPATEEPTANANTNANANAESDPFLVPTDVDLALNTHIREVDIFTQHATDLKGGLYIKNGTLILDEMGFVCRAAKLQLTAMYRTPRRNHLYVGFDYHMIDVDIDELLTMIPNLEQMVPMLSSFKGAAQFHAAAETYLNSKYEPKMSTLRGAASLTGKDLVVLDGETFSKISKLLLFNKKTENKIDSINAELTIYKNEIDIYPLCVQMDNYMVALGGRHNTNMTFDYDINVLSPIYLGVNVSGTIDDLKIKLAKCKFAQDFKPHWYQKADTQSLELRQRIKQSMEKNVRIQ